MMRSTAAVPFRDPLGQDRRRDPVVDLVAGSK